MQIIRYTADLEEKWNQFLTDSINSTFLFNRNFMDYHSDRFSDHSIVVADENGNWLGLIPGCEIDKDWHSHAGLSYGGLVHHESLSQIKVIAVFERILEYLESCQFCKVTIKLIPDIYTTSQSRSFEYALTYTNFRLYRRDVSTTLYLGNRKKIKKGRKSSIAAAKKMGLFIANSQDLEAFLQLENENLASKYQTSAVHTHQELELLAERFPDNIKLYTATYDERLVAGGVVFITPKVMHLQYFAANAEGQRLGASDLIIERLLEQCKYQSIDIFDFGISSEKQGKYLNAGLLRYKESFGAVTTINDFYEKEINREGA